MTNYKIIELEGMDGVLRKHIIVKNEDGSTTSFPAMDHVPEYQAWLAQGNKPLPPEGSK